MAGTHWGLSPCSSSSVGPTLGLGLHPSIPAGGPGARGQKTPGGTTAPEVANLHGLSSPNLTAR
jgi:hypothetical protein